MSSGTPEATETVPRETESLLARFENVDVVFDDLVVAKPTSDVFHRLNHASSTLRVACSASLDADDLQLATPEAVHREGLSPCRNCYQSIFEYLAAHPDSPVEFREQSIEIKEVASENVEAFEPVRPRPEPDPLLGLTDQVMITSGSKVIHAPQPNGPLCGKSGDYRCVDRIAVEGHYRPCKNCFLVNKE